MRVSLVSRMERTRHTAGRVHTCVHPGGASVGAKIDPSERRVEHLDTRGRRDRGRRVCDGLHNRQVAHVAIRADRAPARAVVGAAAYHGVAARADTNNKSEPSQPPTPQPPGKL